MNMNEHELREWQARNKILQDAYHEYLHSTNGQKKEVALRKIQEALSWSRFVDFVSRDPFASVTGLTQYGLDSNTEKCISEIDQIANGNKGYQYLKK